MGAGTLTAKLPIKAVSAMMSELISHPGQGRTTNRDDLRKLFRENQIDATIAMLDTDGTGVAILAQTPNGWLIRIPLTAEECLDLARTLLAKVRAR